MTRNLHEYSLTSVVILTKVQPILDGIKLVSFFKKLLHSNPFACHVVRHDPGSVLLMDEYGEGDENNVEATTTTMVDIYLLQVTIQVN